MNDFGFFFYTSYMEKLKRLTDEQLGILMRLLLQYKEMEEQPDISDPMIGMAFDFIKADIDRQNENYQKKSAAGKKSGEKRRNTSEQIEADGNTIEQTSTDANTTEQNGTDVNRTEQTSTIKKEKEEKREGEKEKEENILSNTVVLDRTTHADVQRIADMWNALPPPVAKVTRIVPGQQRDKQIKARLKEYSLADFEKAIDNIRHSEFLLGKKTNWMINFDWFIRPNNFPKVLEGQYSDHPPEAQSADEFLLELIRSDA